jgi:hypothetical protein
MADYARLRIEKIKSGSRIANAYLHNQRLEDVASSIPELQGTNEELIPLPSHDGFEMSYADAIDQRLENVPYRSNSVKAYEIIMNYPKDDRSDLDAWKKASVDWLKKTFNVAGDGKNNVLHAVLHNDEAGMPHIHSIVVPVDERGKLCARSFTGGWKNMVDLQTSYARSLESLNIERGIQGSRARPMKMQKMYAKFNADTTLPEPEAGETAVQYKARIEDKATQILAVSHRRAGEDYRKVMRTAGRGWNLYVERQKEELKAETGDMKERLLDGRRQIEELEERKDSLRNDISEAEERIRALEEQERQLESVRQSALLFEQQEQDARKYRLAMQRAYETALHGDSSLLEMLEESADSEALRETEKKGKETER